MTLFIPDSVRQNNTQTMTSSPGATQFQFNGDVIVDQNVQKIAKQWRIHTDIPTGDKYKQTFGFLITQSPKPGNIYLIGDVTGISNISIDENITLTITGDSTIGGGTYNKVVFSFLTEHQAKDREYTFIVKK